MTEHEGAGTEHEPSHWADYETDALEQLLRSLEASDLTDVPMTVAAVAGELERRAAMAKVRRGQGEFPSHDDWGRATDAKTLLSEDQGGSDRDHTSSNRDQGSSDRDQVASDRDQAASDRDQHTSDDDQAAADVGLAAGLDRATYDRTTRARGVATGVRESASKEREEASYQRGKTASDRDNTARLRDINSDERDAERRHLP